MHQKINPRYLERQCGLQRKPKVACKQSLRVRRDSGGLLEGSISLNINSLVSDDDTSRVSADSPLSAATLVEEDHLLDADSSKKILETVSPHIVYQCPGIGQ